MSTLDARAAGMPTGLDGDDSRTWTWVARTLLERIESGMFGPGGPIPPVAEIARETGVSLTTASRAYTYLEGREAIRYSPGARYRVSSPADGAPRAELTVASGDRALGALQLVWGAEYEIRTDGLKWQARRLDGAGELITMPGPAELNAAIRADCMRRAVLMCELEPTSARSTVKGTSRAEVYGMTDRSPVHRRLLGITLRERRERLGYVLEDAARLLACNRSKISRIETGQRGIRDKELLDLLTEYGEFSEQERAVLVDIARAGNASGWWLEYKELLPAAVREYMQLEAIAARIQVYDPQQIPALLQTTDYAAALAAGAGQPSDAEPTLARQRAVLEERQPELAVVIGEAALHYTVGEPETMCGQLRGLAEAAGDPHRVTIQVLPFARGACAGGSGGPVTILRFAPATGLGVVYLPRPGHAGTWLISPADLTSYTAAFTRLSTAALSPADSAELLHELAGSAIGRPAGTALARHGGVEGNLNA